MKKYLFHSLLLIILLLIPHQAEGMTIHEYLHTFKSSIDKRVEIVEVEIALEERDLLVRGEMSNEETLKRLLQEIETHYPVYTTTVDIVLLHRGFGLIHETEVELMKSPSSQEVVTQVLYCTPVKILREEGDFFLVQGPDSYLGWVKEKDLTILSSHEELLTLYRDRVLVQEESTSLYQRPHGEKVLKVLHGTRLPIVDQDGSWLRVGVPSKERWIREEDVMLERVGTIEEIIETALLYLETPYLWGGTNIKGSDCSGYIQRILDVHMIKYPRDSDQQHLFSTPTTEERERGDLLFFSTYQTGASHLGLYLGDGRFIHSSSSAKGVVIHSLYPGAPEYNEYLKERLLDHRKITMNTEELVPWLRED